MTTKSKMAECIRCGNLRDVSRMVEVDSRMMPVVLSDGSPSLTAGPSKGRVCTDCGYSWVADYLRLRQS